MSFTNQVKGLTAMFRKAVEKQATPFDTDDPIHAVLSHLLETGVIVIPQYPSEVTLTAYRDGRRSRQKYPDVLRGWQYLGQLNAQGKPAGAPRWAAERMRYTEHDGMVLHSTLSSLPITLSIGDWIVRNDNFPFHDRPCIYRITAGEVDRWYST